MLVAASKVENSARGEPPTLPLSGDRFVDAEEAAEVLGMTVAAVRKHRPAICPRSELDDGYGSASRLSSRGTTSAKE